MILHVKSWNQESMTAMIFSDGHTIRAAFSGTNWPMNEYSMWLAEKGTDYITPDRTECKYIQTGMPEDLLRQPGAPIRRYNLWRVLKDIIFPGSFH